MTPTIVVMAQNPMLSTSPGRSGRGHDRSQIAIRALVSVSTVNRWERDPSKLTFNSRARIERAICELGLADVYRFSAG